MVLITLKGAGAGVLVALSIIPLPRRFSFSFLVYAAAFTIRQKNPTGDKAAHTAVTNESVSIGRGFSRLLLPFLLRE